jgi:hypothetical protein
MLSPPIGSIMCELPDEDDIVPGVAVGILPFSESTLVEYLGELLGEQATNIKTPNIITIKIF